MHIRQKLESLESLVNYCLHSMRSQSISFISQENIEAVRTSLTEISLEICNTLRMTRKTEGEEEEDTEEEKVLSEIYTRHNTAFAALFKNHYGSLFDLIVSTGHLNNTLILAFFDSKESSQHYPRFLRQAIEKETPLAVTTLLYFNKNTDFMWRDGFSPLTLVIRSYNEDIIKAVLATRPNLFNKDREEKTPIERTPCTSVAFEHLQKSYYAHFFRESIKAIRDDLSRLLQKYPNQAQLNQDTFYHYLKNKIQQMSYHDRLLYLQDLMRDNTACATFLFHTDNPARDAIYRINLNYLYTINLSLQPELSEEFLSTSSPITPSDRSSTPPIPTHTTSFHVTPDLTHLIDSILYYQFQYLPHYSNDFLLAHRNSQSTLSKDYAADLETLSAERAGVLRVIQECLTGQKRSLMDHILNHFDEIQDATDIVKSMILLSRRTATAEQSQQNEAAIMSAAASQGLTTLIIALTAFGIPMGNAQNTEENQDTKQKSPVLAAAQGHHITTLKYLLETGGKWKPTEVAPLQICCENNNKVAVLLNFWNFTPPKPSEAQPKAQQAAVKKN